GDELLKCVNDKMEKPLLEDEKYNGSKKIQGTGKHSL
ncbi:hypothetical protein LCGC14_2385560, partial [marine sediment metagenome]